MRLFYSKILTGIIGMLLVGFLLAVLFIIKFSHQQFTANLERQLLTNATLVAEIVREKGLSPETATQVDEALRQLGKKLKLRLTVILPDGSVVADSSGIARMMENHLQRPEVQAALKGEPRLYSRVSYTLGIPMTYLAVPVIEGEKTVAVVRVALPTGEIQEQLHLSIYRTVLSGAAIGGLIVVILSLFIAGIYSKPIAMLKDAARNIARGNFNQRVLIKGSDELAQLAEALNEMSQRLGEYFTSLQAEKERLKAVLGSMNEELLLVGSDNVIYLANPAFCRLLGLEPEKVINRKYWEFILIHDLLQFIEKALTADKSEQSELAVKQEGQGWRYFLLSSSPLKSDEDGSKGIVVVFHDITPIKDMERIRREFVDNVSHELKTPISTVLATVETLLDREPASVQTRKNFYQNIYNHTQRLNNLINDILDLSAIEQKRICFEFKPHNLADIINSVVENYTEAITRKGHTLSVNLPAETAIITVDRAAIEKAVGNILDNAIKYTEPGGKINIQARKEDNFWRIDITDTGIGIPAESLPRIFERFYRVDRARSIKSGGTGLGLAIAKHIVEAHHGKICCESTPGKGSTFSVYLPA